MRPPAYQLRPNKAVDRLIFVEAIRRLETRGRLDEYTYYGLGGPYLEDFRLLYEMCPTIRMVSLERDPDILKRQRFHVPCNRLTLEEVELRSFVAQYDPRNEKSIFWLDYTGLEYAHFETFAALLGKVAADSMIKLTLRAKWNDYLAKAQEFRERFGALMPDPAADPPTTNEGYASLLQAIVRIAAQRALPSAVPLMFQPICSFYYSDGTPMFTVTGLVCFRSEKNAMRAAFRSWEFASFNWAKPKRIDVPILTTKERLHLQSRLPCHRRSGQVLRRTLGYLIDENQNKTDSTLKQYALFHRYSPYFMRAIP